MPLHSVEGLLDATTDTEVRREWAALAEAGPPSQSKHQGTTNAPHVTLALGGAVPDYVEARIARTLETMQPVPVRLGSLLVMGSRQVGEALAVLGRARPLDGTIESVRRWDPDAGRTWQVGGLPTMGA